jgi:hypothetical protein
MNHYRYEIISKKSRFRACVDWTFADSETVLRAGHIYHVRFNDASRRPRIVNVCREIHKAERQPALRQGDA